MARKHILGALMILAVVGPSVSCSSVDVEPVLTVALSADPICLDPHRAPYTESLHVGRQLVDTLTDQDPDTGEIMPALAQSWTVSPDATRYEFTLRDGVTFSDGAILDASVVAENFLDLVELGAESPFGASYTANLISAAAVAARTVVFEFSSPSAQFLQATSMVTTGLLSPDTLNRSADERCAGKLSGTGPFVLDDYAPNESAVLFAREDYNWPSSRNGRSGRAGVERIDFVVMPEAGVRAGALLSGQIDVDTDVRPESEAGLNDQSLSVLSRPRPGMGYTLLPNVTSELLSDPLVRTAIGRGIDRQGIDSVLSRHEHHATSVLSSSTPLYENIFDVLSYDPDSARAALDAAGWTPSPDQAVRSKNGVALAPRLVYSNTDTRADVYQIIQQQLTEIGVALQLVPMAAGGVQDATAAGEYEFLCWAITRPDPQALDTVFRLTSTNPNKRVAPSPIDDTLAALSRTTDPLKRQELTDTAVDELVTDGFAVPLFEQAAVIGVSAAVSGIELDASSRPLFYGTSIE